MFQCGQRDLTYVKKLKEQFSPDQWPGLRERLLAEKTLSGNLREELLEMEGLYGRLMDRVAALESPTREQLMELITADLKEPEAEGNP